MYHRIVLTLVISLFLATSAFAGIQPRAFSLSPMYGGHIFDDDQNFDNSHFWSLALGYNITDRATLEAVYSQTDAEKESASDTDATVRTFRLDALYPFLPDNALVPYLAIGVGEINTNPDVGQNKRHLLGDIGAGVKYFLNDFIALRADLRYLLDFPEPENNLLYSAGLLFQFGGAAAAAEPVVIEQPAPTAEPVPAPAPVPGQPQDSDGDGVIDTMDICPNTLPGTTVDSVGCPLDGDKDGVYDDNDACPNTPSGVSVDEKGCPTKLTLRINFGLDSDKIGSQYDFEIAKAATCINNFPGNLVYIDGHTDSQGSEAYNQQLSERRATAVKNRLTEKFNISAKRMTARGFGESMPVADNNTKEGRFANRRVEVACGATE